MLMLHVWYIYSCSPSDKLGVGMRFAVFQYKNWLPGWNSIYMLGQVVSTPLQWCDTHIFLIMEYCNGGDLSTFIHSRRTLKESSARKFLRQLGGLCMTSLERVWYTQCTFCLMHAGNKEIWCKIEEGEKSGNWTQDVWLKLPILSPLLYWSGDGTPQLHAQQHWISLFLAGSKMF